MSMNFWHIQLHPDDRLSTETLISILETKKVIGLGEAWPDKNGNPVQDPNWFKNDMRIGDIVMVRDTTTPVAIVKVTGNAFVEKNADQNFDWFTLRREIEILDFFDAEGKLMLDKIIAKFGVKYIQASGTLTYCNGNNATTEFTRSCFSQDPS